jgi:hypothetical protein
MKARRYEVKCKMGMGEALSASMARCRAIRRIFIVSTFVPKKGPGSNPMTAYRFERFGLA